MDEISNKTLAILLIGAIVISLGGTLISLNRLARIRIPTITGLATTDEATVTLEITGLAEVNFTTAAINWGAGTVVSGTRTCTLTTYNASGDSLHENCSTFSPADGGGNLVLENIGNKNVTLDLHTGKTASNFIGGTGPEYQWNISESEEGSCGADSWEITQGAWQTAATTNTTICNSSNGGFLTDDGHDELIIDVRVVIPNDAFGSKDDTITAEITEI